MIITRHWLQEWIDIKNISIEEIAEKLNAIGLEVDSIQKIKIPKNVVVGDVISCQKHPNADKLSVCRVDVGDEVLQIVCGAKNVAKGQMVAVAKVGAVLPNGLKIKEAKLRDVASSGMICSSSELGLPEINDGIMVLDDSIGELEIGKELSEYPLLNDDIIEIELTANRGDCLSIYGVARDISVPFELDLKSIEFEDEDENQLGIGRVLHVNCGDKVESSFVFKAFENSKINANLLMDLRLSLIEENCEDLLQKFVVYTTYTTGVLIRAYDYDAFSLKDEKANLTIKKQENGLDAVMGDKILSLVGISQEDESKAREKSSRVILEANYIHPNRILKNTHGMELKSDRHFYRSTRGSEPDLDFGMNYLINLLQKDCDVMVYAGTQSITQNYDKVIIKLDLLELSLIIGREIPKNRVIDILKRLGFEVQFNNEREALNIIVPPYRHDILNKQDICEEIVRIVGIDNIEAKPYVFAEKLRYNSAYNDFKKRQLYRYKAVSNGFFETMHFVFDDKSRNEKYGFETLKSDLDLANPITSELNSLRTSLLPNILDSVNKNINSGKRSVPLFEIGTVFNSSREESLKIAFVYSGEIGFPNVQNHGKPKIIDFFTFSQKMVNILGKFDLKTVETKQPFFNPYEYVRVIKDGIDIGFISKLHINVQKDFNLLDTYVCELDFEKLSYEKIEVKPYSKFQALSRDLSLLTNRDISYSKIKNFLENIIPKEIIKFVPIDIYESEELGENLSLTIKFYFQSENETLKDEVVTSVLDNVLDALNKEFGITIR